MTPILLYWLIPGRLRRMPVLLRIALASAALLGTACGYVVINSQKLQAIQSGSFLIPAIILFFGSPAIFVIFGSFAGATLIAGEKQRQTWETLLLSLMRPLQVVLLKYVARLTFCLVLALPASMWLAAIAYKIMQFGGTGMSDSPNHATLQSRSLIFAIWTSLQVLGHLAPFVAFGMAVSARCSKVNHALLICAAALTAYGVVFWMTVTNTYGQRALNSSNPDLPFLLFRWPVLPYIFGSFDSTTDVLQRQWLTTLCADFIWIVVVPLLLLIPTVAWSRLTRRASRRARHTAVG